MVWYSDHRLAFLMYVPASVAGLLATQVCGEYSDMNRSILDSACASADAAHQQFGVSTHLYLQRSWFRSAIFTAGSRKQPAAC